MTKLYGKGHLVEIERGKKYRIRLSGGKDPVTGKYRQITETFVGTRRQAQLRIEQIRREAESGRALNADRVTLAEWLEQYLANRESMGKHRPPTLKQDRTLSKHLLRGLGSARVVDITPAMVTAFYRSLRSAGVGDTTVKQCHRLLKAVLEQAVLNDLIMRNPCDRVETPKNPKPKRQSLSIAEANRMATICASGVPTANRTAVYIALATGARLGEIMGLQWQHIALDDERPYIYIVQQFTGAGELAPLKTDADDNPVGRVVPIDAATAAVLQSWRLEQREQLNVLGVEQGNDTPVITNQLGSFVNHSCFEHWWRGFCVDNGFGKRVTEDGKQIITLMVGEDAELYPDADYHIMWRDAEGWPCDAHGNRYSRTYKRPRVKSRYEGLRFHSLRHTHFSLRLASGTDLITAQYLGGWKSTKMLTDVYAHPVAEAIWKSAGFMDALTAGKQA